MARRPAASRSPADAAAPRALPPPCEPPLSCRRQLQVQDVKAKYPDVPKYRGLLDCLFGIVRRDGVRGLYRGLWPNYLKVAPSISIQFVVFEAVCKRLQRSSERIERTRARRQQH